MKSNILTDYMGNDQIFNSVFPLAQLSKLITHLTPLEVAIAAAGFLTESGNNKILDIGSGPGKFCLIGASTTDGMYTGVERRNELSSMAALLAKKFNLERIHFIKENISNIDFSEFDGFYLFNPFYENLETEARMDYQFSYSYKHYQEFTNYVKQQLSEMPLGTKVAAFHGHHHEIPASYKSKQHSVFSSLKLFTKKFSGG